MIDRFGQNIVVGWAAHELLWLEVAMESRQGLKELSDLTGRPLEAIQNAAWRYRRARAVADRKAQRVHMRTKAEMSAAQFLEHIARRIRTHHCV